MPKIELKPWSEEDFSLLERLNTLETTKFLGGPESKEQLLHRHNRYLEAAVSSTVRVFKIVYSTNFIPVGQVCYWERTWQDQLVWESGWAVLPAYQGQGVASQALTLLLEKARYEQVHRFLHAFPSVENEASNALCRKLGFTKVEECDFEYPPGKLVRCNDWQFDLFNRKNIQVAGENSKNGFHCGSRLLLDFFLPDAMECSELASWLQVRHEAGKILPQAMEISSLWISASRSPNLSWLLERLME